MSGSTADFWTWAVRVYASPGVAEQCLALQDDHGQCVPLLLWAAWTSESGIAINDALAAEAAGLAQSWSDEVVVPLRALRRRLKSPVSGGDERARLPLREKIKSTELAAEQAMMGLLEGIVLAGVPQNINSKQMVVPGMFDALVIAAAAWGTKVPHEALARLTERLTKG